jgi:hypothetical protein
VIDPTFGTGSGGIASMICSCDDRIGKRYFFGMDSDPLALQVAESWVKEQQKKCKFYVNPPGSFLIYVFLVIKKGIAPSPAPKSHAAERFREDSVEEQEEEDEVSEENEKAAASEPPTKRRKLSRLDMFHLHAEKQKVKPSKTGKNPFIDDEASVNTRADKAEVMCL